MTPRPGLSGGSWTPSTSSTPGHGSSRSRRLPSRSTWSNRLATWAPAETARPDSFMQPSISAQAERAAGVRDPHRLADPAGLGELDRQPVRALGAGGHVRERVAVLVDVDRQRRAPLQLRPVRVAGRQRLLAVLDAERGQLRQRLERLVERPRLVHVDLQRHVGHRANGAHALDVEPVAPAELQLQPLEPPAHLLGAPPHVVGIAEPDRPRGRRPRPLEPEHPPDRQARELAAEVVQRCVEPRLGRLLARPLGQRARRSPRARTGRRRAARRRPPGTPAPNRPTRRSARSGSPRRSR